MFINYRQKNAEIPYQNKKNLTTKITYRSEQSDLSHRNASPENKI